MKRGITHEHLQLILHFIYYGEAAIPAVSINEFLRIAKEWQISGISENENENESYNSVDATSNNRSDLEQKVEAETDLAEESDTSGIIQILQLSIKFGMFSFCIRFPFIFL